MLDTQTCSSKSHDKSFSEKCPQHRAQYLAGPRTPAKYVEKPLTITFIMGIQTNQHINDNTPRKWLNIKSFFLLFNDKNRKTWWGEGWNAGCEWQDYTFILLSNAKLSPESLLLRKLRLDELAWVFHLTPGKCISWHQKKLRAFVGMKLLIVVP